MVELPSDSSFAVAMKNQQQAEKEEQQRIKNLVLNYDLRENEDPDGEPNSAPPNPNRSIYNSSFSGHERPSTYHHNRPDNNKSGKERGSQRVRKLQLSDVDWYGKSQRKMMTRLDDGSALSPSHPGVERGGHRQEKSWHRDSRPRQDRT